MAIHNGVQADAARTGLSDGVRKWVGRHGSFVVVRRLGAPKLSADLVAQLNKMINDAVQELKSEGQLAKLGIEPMSETPSQFKAFAKSYVSRNAELLKASNFEPI